MPTEKKAAQEATADIPATDQHAPAEPAAEEPAPPAGQLSHAQQEALRRRLREKFH